MAAASDYLFAGMQLFAFVTAWSLVAIVATNVTGSSVQDAIDGGSDKLCAHQYLCVARDCLASHQLLLHPVQVKF